MGGGGTWDDEDARARVEGAAAKDAGARRRATGDGSTTVVGWTSRARSARGCWWGTGAPVCAGTGVGGRRDWTGD